jgi:hypothetical protein
MRDSSPLKGTPITRSGNPEVLGSYRFLGTGTSSVVKRSLAPRPSDTFCHRMEKACLLPMLSLSSLSLECLSVKEHATMPLLLGSGDVSMMPAHACICTMSPATEPPSKTSTHCGVAASMESE